MFCSSGGQFALPFAFRVYAITAFFSGNSVCVFCSLTLDQVWWCLFEIFFQYILWFSWLGKQDRRSNTEAANCSSSHRCPAPPHSLSCQPLPFSLSWWNEPLQHVFGCNLNLVFCLSFASYVLPEISALPLFIASKNDCFSPVKTLFSISSYAFPTATWWS